MSSIRLVEMFILSCIETSNRTQLSTANGRSRVKLIKQTGKFTETGGFPEKYKYQQTYSDTHVKRSIFKINKLCQMSVEKFRFLI